METAFKLALEALDVGEVPIGCAFVDPADNQVVAVGRNRTNETGNATRHAEIEAIDQLVAKGITDLSGLSLFVTVEPCIMCAAALRMLRAKQVFFGCFNERFGGCGSIMSAHIMQLKQWPILDAKPADKDSARRAVLLLRRFYMRENERAPTPRKKSNRILKDYE
jgi:tRNA-specific adenosine deaminase 2